MMFFFQVTLESWRWSAASSVSQRMEELRTREVKVHFMLPWEQSEVNCTQVKRYVLFSANSQFDPSVCDHSGKKPTDGKPKSDKRIQILQEAAQRFKSAEKQPKSGKSKRKRLRKKAKEKESAQSDPKPEEEEAWEFDENLDDMPESVDTKPILKTLSTVAFADNPILVSVKATLELILSHKDDYFRAPAIATSKVIQTPTLEAASKTAEHSPPLPQPDECNTNRKSVFSEPINLASAEHESSDE